MGDTQLVTAFFTNGNDITGLHLEGRNVHGLAINTDCLMGNQLTRLGTSRAEAHAVNHVIQTALQQLQQVLASSAFTAGGFLVVAAELTLEHAVDATNFLLFAQLSTVIGQASTTLAVYTRRGFDVALGFERAYTTLQKEIGAFTTRQFALGTNITSHFSLSPDYTRRFFGGRHPLCGIGVTSVMLAIL